MSRRRNRPADPTEFRNKMREDLHRRAGELASRSAGSVLVASSTDPLGVDDVDAGLELLEADLEPVEQIAESIIAEAVSPTIYEVDLQIAPLPTKGIRVSGQVRRRNPTRAYVFRGDGRLGGEEVIVWGGVTRHSPTGTAKAVVTVQPIFRTSTGWGATGNKRVIELKPRGGDWGKTPLDEIAWALREYVNQMGFKGPLAAPRSVAMSNPRGAAALRRSLT